jgi:hypothetical protein
MTADDGGNALTAVFSVFRYCCGNLRAVSVARHIDIHRNRA